MAAVNANGVKASYSYYGNDTVSVSAPGGEPGQLGKGIFLPSTPQNYVYGAGTSFASPHVAGLIALLFSLDNTLSHQQAISIISTSATDLNSANPGYEGMLGAGLINIVRALAATSTSTHIPASTPSNEPTLLNVNDATMEQLADLPLIGTWSATMIVTYRDLHGPYEVLNDLLKSDGLDLWTLQQIKHLIVVEPPAENVEPGASASGTATEPAPQTEMLDINTASIEQLAAVPLLGEWSAGIIVSYRNTNGPYATIWDLTMTGIIDTWVISQIKPYIFVA